MCCTECTYCKHEKARRQRLALRCPSGSSPGNRYPSKGVRSTIRSVSMRTTAAKGRQWMESSKDEMLIATCAITKQTYRVGNRCEAPGPTNSTAAVTNDVFRRPGFGVVWVPALSPGIQAATEGRPASMVGRCDAANAGANARGAGTATKRARMSTLIVRANDRNSRSV